MFSSISRLMALIVVLLSGNLLLWDDTKKRAAKQKAFNSASERIETAKSDPRRVHAVSSAGQLKRTQVGG